LPCPDNHPFTNVGTRNDKLVSTYSSNIWQKEKKHYNKSDEGYISLLCYIISKEIFVFIIYYIITMTNKEWFLEWSVNSIKDLGKKAFKKVETLAISGDQIMEKMEKKIKNWIAVTKNTYRDVSNTVKSSIDTWRENTKEISKNTLNYAERKVSQLESFKQRLILDSAKGIIKWITITKDTGIMVVDYWTKKVNVFIGTAKQEIANIKNEIIKWTITSITYIKNAPEVAITIGKKKIKKWLSVAVAAWILVYRWWEFVVNQSIKLAWVATKESIETGKYVANKTIEVKNKVVKTAKEIKDAGVKTVNDTKNIIVDSVKEIKKDVVATIDKASNYGEWQITDIRNEWLKIASDVTKDASDTLSSVSNQLDPSNVLRN